MLCLTYIRNSMSVKDFLSLLVSKDTEYQKILDFRKY